MSTHPSCIITGVTLYHRAEGWCKPADLFIFGDRYIVNAAGPGELREPNALDNVLAFSDYAVPYFERRNVYIFPADPSLLNAAAQAYIARYPNAS